MNLEEDILVERFLRNKLSDIELKTVLEKIDSDSIFKEKVLFEKQLFESLDQSNWSFVKNINSTQVEEYEKLYRSKEVLELKKNISEINKNYIDNKSFKNKKWMIYSSAATIIFLISIYFFNFLKPNNLELYSNYMSSSEIPSMNNRGNDIDFEMLSKGEAFFYNKEYKKSEEIFFNALKTNNSNSSVYLFLAISQIETNQFIKAENTLNSLINSNLIDAEKGYWFKSLLYLKSNQIEKVKNNLSIIIKNSYFNHKKAEIVLKKIKDL